MDTHIFKHTAWLLNASQGEMQVLRQLIFSSDMLVPIRRTSLTSYNNTQVSDVALYCADTTHELVVSTLGLQSFFPPGFCTSESIKPLTKEPTRSAPPPLSAYVHHVDPYQHFYSYLKWQVTTFPFDVRCAGLACLKKAIYQQYLFFF